MQWINLINLFESKKGIEMREILVNVDEQNNKNIVVVENGKKIEK